MLLKSYEVVVPHKMYTFLQVMASLNRMTCIDEIIRFVAPKIKHMSLYVPWNLGKTVPVSTGLLSNLPRI